MIGTACRRGRQVRVTHTKEAGKDLQSRGTPAGAAAAVDLAAVLVKVIGRL